MQDVAPTPINLNPEREDELRQWLIAHYRPVYGEGTQAYVESVLDLSGYVDRFNYLRSVAPDVFRRGAALAVSGFALGSEMIVARQLGFDPVCGVEVEHFLVEATQRRLAYLPGMQLDYYAGDILPYPDEAFAVVTSGHVIEHTQDPALYLRECMRVLQPGGVLALEFPTRYHYRELHTRLPSLEWLPKPIRNLGLHALSHPKAPLPNHVKVRYQSILGTNLQQVSPRDVKRALTAAGIHYVLLNVAKPAPGIVRCTLRKTT